MKRLAVFLFLMSACSPNSEAPSTTQVNSMAVTDTEYSKKIVGRWFYYTGSSMGYNIGGELEFSDDNKFAYTQFGPFKNSDGSISYSVRKRNANYRIQNGEIILEFIEPYCLNTNFQALKIRTLTTASLDIVGDDLSFPPASRTTADLPYSKFPIIEKPCPIIAKSKTKPTKDRLPASEKKK